jgi:hypothetical protein
MGVAALSSRYATGSSGALGGEHIPLVICRWTPRMGDAFLPRGATTLAVLVRAAAGAESTASGCSMANSDHRIMRRGAPKSRRIVSVLCLEVVIDKGSLACTPE